MNRFWVCTLVSLVGMLMSSLYVVQEGQRGLVLRFNAANRDAEQLVQVQQPGLHFKLPWIDSVKILDARIQTMDSHADRFITSEKKDLIVDSYVKWRIVDFGRYYLSTGGDPSKAQLLIKRKISDRLRSEIGNRTIRDIVSGSRGELMEDARNSLNTGDDGTVKQGIHVVDVRIKQINLPTEVSSSIYQRMRAERDAVAREHRSQGREQAAIVRADVDRRVAVMLAEAGRKAQVLQGEGDATVAMLFAQAFSQHPEFYLFIRSLKAYESSFGQQDLLVLSPDSQFFRYMASSNSKTGK